MNPLPKDPRQRVLFVLFLLFLAGSCVAPPYPQFLLMQHVPTLAAAVVLVWTTNRFPVGHGSFAAAILFLGLHTLGARYLYSYCPYDDWSERLLGFRIGAVCGFERNHYDRFVHFCYGLLLAVPVQDFERRHLGLSWRLSAVLAVEFVLATSAAYELLEWLVALVFAPNWAESFLGQQGDPFDAQKDMALATAGALVSISVAGLGRLCRDASARRA